MNHIDRERRTFRWVFYPIITASLLLLFFSWVYISNKKDTRHKINAMTHYTMQVTLCNNEVLTYKNLTVEQVKEFQAKVWTQGVKKQITMTTFELISPFLISKILLHEQISLEPTE